MLTTAMLLDAAKRAHGMPSDYRLCRTLGATDNTMYNWRKGKSHPDDAYSLKLAKLAGIDVAFVLMSMSAVRSSDPEIRAAMMTAAREYSAAHPARTVDILSRLNQEAESPKSLRADGSKWPAMAPVSACDTLYIVASMLCAGTDAEPRWRRPV